MEKEPIEEMDIELLCVIGRNCKGGPGGETWKSKLLPFKQAFMSMQLHIIWFHENGVKESIHDEEEVVVAELESVPSHMNLSQNEDSSVPEVISLMVDKEESVVSTTEHKSVQEQGSYPSAGQS